MSTDHPNILLITSDQQRGDAFGFEGRAVRTPHLDRMAAAGTRFEACITPNVICQPARASMLTGLLPLTHGVHDNGIDLDPAVGEAGFAGRLASAGYRTGFVGKAHFSTVFTFEPTGTPECMHDSPDYGDDWNGPYMGFEHVELVNPGHPMPPMAPPHGHHYERFYSAGGRKAELDELYKAHVGPPTDAPQTHSSALPPAFHHSTFVADRTIELLRGRDDRPFCLWASFPDPHHPFDCPAPWALLHDPDDVDLPAHRELDLDRRVWWHRAALTGTPETDDETVRAVREGFSRIPTPTEAQLRHLIANYYGMISFIDHNVGRMLEALRELGLADDTIVVFTSDHGDWLGDHGLVLKGPMHYEGLLRVGCVVTGPGVPAGRVVHDPVSTIDLAATFYDWGGIDEGTLHGRSLVPLIEGRDGASRETAYNEWNLHPDRCGVALHLRTARSRRHKLTLDTISGAGELYDLVDDPHELEDRFDDPALRGVRADLEDVIRSRPTDDVMDPLPPQVGMA